MDHRSPYSVSSHYRPAPPPGHSQAPAPGPAGAPLPYGGYPAVGVTEAMAPASPQSRQVLVVGGSMLALAALVITPRLNQSQVQEVEPFTCMRQEQPKALVSRDQIKTLLATELQTPKATVQGFLTPPDCVLSPGKTEAGLPADREAYPLEFDPQTWLVVLYEGDRYAGYDFRFR